MNQGITILPQSKLEKVVVKEDEVKIIPLFPTENWQVGIAWQKNNYVSYATKTWIRFIEEKLKARTLIE